MKRPFHNVKVADSYLQAETSPYLCLDRLFLAKVQLRSAVNSQIAKAVSKTAVTCV